MTELTHRIAHRVQSSGALKEALFRGALVILVGIVLVGMAIAGMIDLKGGVIPSTIRSVGEAVSRLVS